MKLYTGFVNDHTGSMTSVSKAALKDSNILVKTIKDSATNEQLDSIVSVVGLGLQSNTGFPLVRREVVISNPHVLKERTSWPTPGGNSPLWDAIFEIIALHESLPDASDPNVSFCIFITTDGQQGGSYTKLHLLADKIRALQATGCWTFVARVPTGGVSYMDGTGIPAGNIQEWDTTVAGMERSTVQTQSAVTSFMKSKAAGTNSSSSFYTNAAAVNTAALTDITSEVKLYQVPAHGGRLRIDDFILGKRKTYLKGAAFVQLVKTEPKIGPKKIVLIRERNAPNRIYAGKEARAMIGMPTDPTSNARVHPGDHGAYDIFIQSESLNRLLPDNVGVIYWEKQGVPFTQADIDQFAPKVAPAAPAVPVLPAVVGRTKPTPSPVPKAAPAPTGPVINGRPVKFFLKRDDAREYARVNKLPKGSLGDFDRIGGIGSYAPGQGRWFVYTA